MAEDKFKREEYIKGFEEKNANLPCHRCGHKSFTLIEGYSYLPIHEKMDSGILGGPTVPAVLIVCNNCGAITPHAVGAFNPFKNENEKEVKNG